MTENQWEFPHVVPPPPLSYPRLGPTNEPRRAKIPLGGLPSAETKPLNPALVYPRQTGPRPEKKLGGRTRGGVFFRVARAAVRPLFPPRFSFNPIFWGEKSPSFGM